ncbi:hypothetical protein ACHAWC_009483 [Mediolabrus comicus]
MRTSCRRHQGRSWRSQKQHQVVAPLHFFSSTSDDEQPPEDSSTIIQGPSLLTMTGVHRPSPSLFYLPGLRSLPFWTAPESDGKHSSQNRQHRIAFNDSTVTAAVEFVESNFESIRAEYFSSVLGQGIDTDPHNNNVRKPLEPDYDVASKGGEHADDALHSGAWDWHSYILNGEKNERFKERCPKTAAVIDELDREKMLFRTPFSFCFFSTLHGNSSIQAHSGPMNLRLRMHLPLVVPPSDSSSSTDGKEQTNHLARPTTGIKVADQARQWREGKALVLDDSYVHEVWNDNESARVLLLLDLWHPDVRREEREKIEAMFVYAKEKGWIGNKRPNNN